MSEVFWSELPEIAVLQWLARGHLKQHLAQALRLWIWLRLLYDPRVKALSLPEPFTYAHCRDALFLASHPTDDARPTRHDPACPCAKTIAAWLFAPELGWTQARWETSVVDYQRTEGYQRFEAELARHGLLPRDFEQFLNQTRLFAVTRRTLASDLQRLAELKWLKPAGQAYERVQSWPPPPGTARVLAGTEAAFLTQPDLAAIADSLSREIGGQRRFFVQVDYVVPQDRHDQVEDWQAALRELWQQSPVPPVRLRYWSASHLAQCEGVVYPVCLYYYRRGPYLCGFGEVSDSSGAIDWRNYRLDRIQSLQPLTWQAAQVPDELRNRYERRTLPTPDEIELRMEAAWGFDYYRPAQRLLLRFDQTWNQRYIRNSLRHSTFERVSYPQAKQLIETELAGKQRAHLLALLASRADEDAYYQAIYRQDDPNVKQRLRAWRPHIEILLPWSLRQQFGREVAQEQQFYQDIGDED
ncbi:MAG: TIGR03985 family CRISPR-associated protein [Leptolyngbya sp. SIO4C1]|nr:TIGR03985 family CRISPR-associated protein [Leptolyngbya sp. SIO4C1]